MFWMLAREILTIRGQITRDNFKGPDGKEVMVDLYFYRDPEEVCCVCCMFSFIDYVLRHLIIDKQELGFSLHT